MKKHLIYIIGIAATLFTACENIPESERFIAIDNPALSDTLSSEDSVTILRTVLLEDYTGQRCSNCPNAHEQATALHNVYHDRLVVVSMHAGMMYFPNSTMKQPEGDEYANKAGVVDYPSGVVNRRTAAMTVPSEWPTAIREEMLRPTNVSLKVKTEIGQTGMNVVATAYSSENVSAKLQLWILEDSIVDRQIMPDGSLNRNYVHNHVFRRTMNGTWGEDISIVAGEETIKEITDFSLDNSWVIKNLSIVGIVYDDEGVIQVTQCKVVQ